MHKIFVNDKPIILTTKVEKEDGFKNYLLKTVDMGKVIRRLNRTKLKEVRLIGKKKKKLLKKFLKKDWQDDLFIVEKFIDGHMIFCHTTINFGLF